MKTLRLFSLLVRDYEEAIRFYTDKLGFTVSEDVTFGEDRWVVLGLRDSGEPGLALTLARTESDLAVVGQAGSFPLFALGIDDCFGEYRRMQERGGLPWRAAARTVGDGGSPRGSLRQQDLLEPGAIVERAEGVVSDYALRSFRVPSPPTDVRWPWRI